MARMAPLAGGFAADKSSSCLFGFTCTDILPRLPQHPLAETPRSTERPLAKMPKFPEGPKNKLCGGTVILRFVVTRYYRKFTT